MLFIIGFDDNAEYVKKTIKRMFLVITNFIEKFVQPRDTQFVFAFVAKEQDGFNECPMGLDVF